VVEAPDAIIEMLLELCELPAPDTSIMTVPVVPEVDVGASETPVSRSKES
jgi:hypothetical protein